MLLCDEKKEEMDRMEAKKRVKIEFQKAAMSWKDEKQETNL